jgi:hypothetical protein
MTFGFLSMVRFSRRGLGVCAAVSVLFGCGLERQTAGLGPLPANVEARPAASERSWMAPGSENEDLLYAAGYGDSKVYVFSYPDGKLVGTLTGVDGPWGVCASRTGDVWITNFVSRDIVEYAHGGTEPIKKLSDASGYPVACSVDPATGNLAVANVYAPHNGRGAVLVFNVATGKAKAYTATGIYYYYGVGYDEGGALFADGTGVHGSFALFLLGKDGTAFATISLKVKLHYPVDVQWLGSYLAVGATTNSSPGESYILHIKVANGSGKTLDVTKIPGDAGAFEVAGSTLIAPEGNEVLFFAYPAGGSPTKRIKVYGMQEPLGVAISSAKSDSR